MAEQKLYPNTFQVHNFYVDECLHLLDGNELKVLLYAIRKIVGWNKQQDYISLSQFQDGAKNSQDGTPINYGTGLGRKTIIDAIGELTKYGLLVKLPPDRNTRKLGDSYALQFNIALVDLKGLQERRQAAEQKNKLKTVKASSQKAVVRATNYGSTNEPRFDQRTTDGSTNEPQVVRATNTQNSIETQFKPKEEKEFHVSHVVTDEASKANTQTLAVISSSEESQPVKQLTPQQELLKAFAELRRVNIKHYSWARVAKDSESYSKDGVTADQVRKFSRYWYTQNFLGLQDKPPTISQIAQLWDTAMAWQETEQPDMPQPSTAIAIARPPQKQQYQPFNRAEDTQGKVKSVFNKLRQAQALQKQQGESDERNIN